MKKLLSISIAAYNVESTIEECLDSFLSCRHLGDLEILVVNDGSQDRTVEIVSEYVKKYPESIRLINKENGGHGSTINAALAAATGEFFRVIDGDDWVDPADLDALCDCLEKTSADLVIDDYREVYPDHERRVSYLADYEPERVYDFSEICPKGNFNEHIFAMHMSSVRTKRLRDVGMKIQEKCFYADTEFIYYVGLAARTVEFHESCVYQYRLGSAGQSVSAEGWYRHIEDFIKIESNLIAMYAMHEAEMMETTRRRYLFAILDTRYTLLFNCFVIKFQTVDKDELLVNFLKEEKERYPQLIARMHLSALNRYVAKDPVHRIDRVRCFRRTSLFKVLRAVKHLLKA